MMNKEMIIPVALRTIELEAESVAGLKAFIDADFVRATGMIISLFINGANLL